MLDWADPAVDWPGREKACYYMCSLPDIRSYFWSLSALIRNPHALWLSSSLGNGCLNATRLVKVIEAHKIPSTSKKPRKLQSARTCVQEENECGHTLEILTRKSRPSEANDKYIQLQDVE
jgi:hypothetical protein